MVWVVDAVYENGVLRPLKELNLKEGMVVRVKVIDRSLADSVFASLKVDLEEVKRVIEEVEGELSVY